MLRCFFFFSVTDHSSSFPALSFFSVQLRRMKIARKIVRKIVRMIVRMKTSACWTCLTTTSECEQLRLYLETNTLGNYRIIKNKKNNQQKNIFKEYKYSNKYYFSFWIV